MFSYKLSCCLWTGLYFFYLWEEDEHHSLDEQQFILPSKLDWDGGLCKNPEVGNRFKGNRVEKTGAGFDGLSVARDVLGNVGLKALPMVRSRLMLADIFYYMNVIG